MEETAWEIVCSPKPPGSCKDRATARPDPCIGQGVGHFLRSPAGSGAIGIGQGAEGLGFGLLTSHNKGTTRATHP